MVLDVLMSWGYVISPVVSIFMLGALMFFVFSSQTSRCFHPKRFYSMSIDVITEQVALANVFL